VWANCQTEVTFLWQKYYKFITTNLFFNFKWCTSEISL